MPREVRALTVCTVCWARRGTEHPVWACIHHKCVCCGFKAMEAAVKTQRVREKTAWLSNYNDGVGEPDPKAGPDNGRCPPHAFIEKHVRRDIEPRNIKESNPFMCRKCNVAGFAEVVNRDRHEAQCEQEQP